VRTFLKNKNLRFQSVPRTPKKIKININWFNHKNKIKMEKNEKTKKMITLLKNENKTFQSVPRTPKKIKININ